MKKAALIILLSSLSLFAYAVKFEVNGIKYSTLYENDSTCKVIGKSKSYIGNITIPESVNYNDKRYSVTYIDEYAFQDDSSITSISIPNSVTDIGKNAFSGCASLVNIFFGNSVETIGKKAFADCTALKSVTVPNSVGRLYEGVFRDCTALEEVILGEGVFATDDLIFSGCTSLRTITLGKNLEYMGKYPFEYCENLKEIISLNPTPPKFLSGTKHVENPFIYVDTHNCIVKVPAESVELYKADEYWKVFWNIVPIESTSMTKIEYENNGNEYFDIYGVKLNIPNKGISIKKTGGDKSVLILVK